MRKVLFSFLSIFLWGLPVSAGPGNNADLVIVDKSERRLYLYQGEELLRTFRIALGKNPVGPKFRRGDNRTPEGRYTLDSYNFV